jgi:hypothetical protein
LSFLDKTLHAYISPALFIHLLWTAFQEKDRDVYILLIRSGLFERFASSDATRTAYQLMALAEAQ